MRFVKDANNYARLMDYGICAKEEILRALDTADRLHWEFTRKEIEITSCVDGIHKVGSRHYVGEAFDIRIWYLSNVNEFVTELRARLGKDYDVILEKTHVHVEFDPKR